MEKQEKPFLPQRDNYKAKLLDYKSLIEKVSEFGDLVILGVKGSCKTTLMMHLARTLKEDAQNHIIIFETFPKWIHEFNSIAYMTIKDSDVQLKEEMPYLEPDRAYIQWSKDYTIINAQNVIQCLKENQNVIFLIECEDMEKISAFMTFVIYTVYRKQYQRAKQNCLETTNERYWFLTEESHNLLDSTVIAKKTFNKLRKIQNEFRNLRMHMICVALRLQDLSPKVRTKMSIILARVNLDDYQLKIRNLLRNSKFRNEITQLEKGKFVYPETDQILETKPFEQNGKPYEWKLKPKPQEPQLQKPKGKLSKISKFLSDMILQKRSHKISDQDQKEIDQENEELDLDQEFLDKDMW